MKIRHLRIFKAVCEEESITKASEKLFITQPAVSTAVNELENYLGVRLFDRVSRKIQLNETGKLFLVKTIKLLALYDDLEKNTKNLEENAVLKIGSSITIANFILPQAMAKFKTACKNTPTRVVVENARTIENMVSENKVDVGLVEGVVYNKELKNFPFSSSELLVICSPQHKYAKEKSIDIDELTTETFLLREEGSAIRDVFDSALLLHNVSVSPAWTSVNSQALIQAVKQNLGISVLPRQKVENELRNGEIVEIRVNDLELISVNHIIFSKGKYETKPFKKLIEILCNKEI